MSNPLLHRRRKRGKDGLALALLAATMAMLGAGLAAGILLRPITLDSQTLCPSLAAPSATTLIVIDTSELLAPRHRKRLRATIEDEANRLPRYGRLSLLSLRPDSPRELIELFSRCNPGDSRSANPLFSNPGRMQARWQEQFADPLKAATARAGTARRAARTSPILEATAAAALDPDFTNFSGPRRLVLVTDLLEHDPGLGFSSYSDAGDLARFLSLRRGFEPPDLSAVSVRVVVLDRPDYLHRQVAAREKLWIPFFERAGAAETRFEGL